MNAKRRPALLVWSSLFPTPLQPQAGIFIRERMFRVGGELPLAVISPQPWFPLQGLVRRWRPHFRLPAPKDENQTGVEVHRPKFLCPPGVLKSLDGLQMALCAWPTVRRLQARGQVDVIDAHFAYPDGYAATLVARWLGVPCTVTLRGTEVRHAQDPALRPRVVTALNRASHVFCVSDSLRRLALELGVPDTKLTVVGNGVDSARFTPLDRGKARARFGLRADAKVLITVGGIVERKGFHRVVECLLELIRRYGHVDYLVVGSGGAEGDFTNQLRARIAELGVGSNVRFLGALPPDDVRVAFSAADVSVLATRNEGWANVLLESLACGVPVVATDVGGNREVIRDDSLGSIVPFGDHAALLSALQAALAKDWDRDAIRRYAVENDWSARIPLLVETFRRLTPASASGTGVEHVSHG